MNKKTIICNPPINFVNNQASHIGHLFYLTLLDVSYRFKKDCLDQDVYLPGRSYNLYGIPSEKYMLEHSMSVQEFKATFMETLERDLSVRNINLSNTDLVVDESKEVERYLLDLVLVLQKRGYIRKGGESLYLQLDKIDEKGFLQELEKVRIYPTRVKNKLLNLFESRQKELEITRERDYAPKLDSIEGKVAPFFIVSLFWEGYYPNCRFILPSSFNLVLRSVLLKTLVDYMAYGKITLSEVFIYPKVVGKDLEKWNIQKISKSPIHKDLLRFSLCSCYSSKGEKVGIGLENLKFATTFFKRLHNIGKSCETIDASEPVNYDSEYISLMQGYQFRKVIHYIWNKALNIDPLTCSSQEAACIIRMIYPICPHIHSILTRDKLNLGKSLDSDINTFIANAYST